MTNLDTDNVVMPLRPAKEKRADNTAAFTPAPQSCEAQARHACSRNGNRANCATGKAK
jgi:hypothetical protein